VDRQSGLVTAKSLTVLGATTINGAVVLPGGITGNLAITGELGVTSHVSIGGNLSVVGSSSLNTLSTIGAATIGGNLGVTGHINAAANVVVEGDLDLTGKVTKALKLPHLAPPSPPPADTSAVYFDANGNPVVRRSDGTIAHLGVPPGTIAFTGGANADIGWALCNGQAISRVNNPALFARYGVIHGPGDGTTTFNIPDLRGRVIAHVDGGAGRLTSTGLGVNATLSAAGGDDTRILTIPQMPSHNHVVHEVAHSHETAATSRSVAGGAAETIHKLSDYPGNVPQGTTEAVKTDITIDPSGGGQAHSVVQPTFVLNAQVKLG